MTRTRSSKPKLGMLATIAIVAFAALLAALIVTRHAAPWTVAVYAAMSVLCAATYLVDKSAAGHGRRRVSERSLLLLGVLGGWPGALVAQRLLRHKTSKASFQWRFRATVMLNVAALVALGMWRSIVR